MSTLSLKQKFKDRKDIYNKLGGHNQQGIAISKKYRAILLFRNEEQIYRDDFYSIDNAKLLYTGIGQKGNQDDCQKNNSIYHLNTAVLSHKHEKNKLLVFDKTGNENEYEFLGEYKLTEMHQNIQPDKEGNLRRVFVFHLERITKENKKCRLILRK